MFATVFLVDVVFLQWCRGLVIWSVSMDVDLARSATSCGRVRTDNLYAVMDLGKLQVLVYPQFSSVQLKMVSMRSEKPICAPPRLSEVSPTLPLKRFQCSSDWRWPSLVLSRKIVWRFLFPRLSLPGDRWCGVLGFVPAARVSSSSTLQIMRKASHLWGLLCPPVYLVGHFRSLRRVQGSTPTGVFEGECRPSTHDTCFFQPLP